MLYASYTSIGAYMEPEPYSRFNGDIIKRHLASKILSASILDSANRIRSIHHLQKPVIITFNTMVSW